MTSRHRLHISQEVVTELDQPTLVRREEPLVRMSSVFQLDLIVDSPPHDPASLVQKVDQTTRTAGLRRRASSGRGTRV